ncbi:HdeA/HdeB family chaperone [Methylocystis heyeri]|uniref:Acid stress chaperone HdeB n=1 Tax=Methylocystis heyeri TaxID=391905 RepID=A0A6B8KD72_9HYPH|nr:HdeA/HdeB family chaperone [Methylocystis heyeri]QGM44985.1 hypothetical protein H2LOC_004370 [Methylocystis heyeri]
MRKIIAIAIVATAFSALPTQAQVSVDMSLISCKQFLDAPPDRQALIANWMRGYFSATKNFTTIDMRYEKRNTEKVLGFCKRGKNKNETLFKAIEKLAK